MIRLSDDVFLNAEWTLASLRKSLKEDDKFEGVCYSCGEELNDIRKTQIAVRDSKHFWQDGMGPIFVKKDVQYCGFCMMAIIDMLKDEVT